MTFGREKKEPFSTNVHIVSFSAVLSVNKPKTEKQRQDFEFFSFSSLKKNSSKQYHRLVQ